VKETSDEGPALSESRPVTSVAAASPLRGVALLALAYLATMVALARPAGFYCCGRLAWPWESLTYAAILFGPPTLVGFLTWLLNPSGRWWVAPLLTMVIVMPLLIIGFGMWIASRI
jgi:hypothetical protein